MCVLAKSLAVGYVEAQVISLIRGRVFINMHQDDELDCSLNGNCNVCISSYSHCEVFVIHSNTGAAGKDEAIEAVHDNFTWSHLDVRALRLVNNNNDGTKICSLLFMTASGSWSANQLPVYSYTFRKNRGKFRVNIKN